jgi:hypothetical protein
MPAVGVDVACRACRDQSLSGAVPRGSSEDRRCALEISTRADSFQHLNFSPFDALSKLFLLVIISKSDVVFPD